jgi:hypothetical protein
VQVVHVGSGRRPLIQLLSSMDLRERCLALKHGNEICLQFPSEPVPNSTCPEQVNKWDWQWEETRILGDGGACRQDLSSQLCVGYCIACIVRPSTKDTCTVRNFTRGDALTTSRIENITNSFFGFKINHCRHHYLYVI